MTRFTLIAVAALSLLAPARPARALQEHVAVGARLGTLGIGADAVVPMNERSQCAAESASSGSAWT